MINGFDKGRPQAMPARITSREAAADMVRDLNRAMDELLVLLEDETRLVKAGKLKEAAELSARKEERAAEYTRLMLVAREEVESLQAFDPIGTESLRRRHELFRSEVQINLAVLATARDVAEDMMKAVASEVGASRPAATYSHPSRSHLDAPVRGFAFDRNL